MAKSYQPMNMPELLVFVRVFAIWFFFTGIFRVAYCLGENLIPLLVSVDRISQSLAIFFVLIICLFYAINRGVRLSISQLALSLRFDLLAFSIFGIWANTLTSSWFLAIQKVIKNLNPWWTVIILVALVLTQLSPLLRYWWSQNRKTMSQYKFLGDDPIETEEEDSLKYCSLAKNFADTVLASKTHAGLVFGVDGAWGVGKTSFINIAEQHWKKAGDSVIVFRFEPLQYAAELDLSERFLRDLTVAIQSQVYAPEFLPAASRYSRILKSIPLFGFRLSIEPLIETIDELLENIDNVLKSIGRRVIVVIDDLDRLDAKSVNNVLFTIKRTFKLSQATYILCYDTENLVKGKDDSDNAREFLEKFITVKLNLFIDISNLRNFLLKDWKKADYQLQTIPVDTMFKLESVLIELAEILETDDAIHYLPLIGNMRKLKRFVNAAMMMQVEKTDFAKTDFNRRDLVNLMLLNLSYPGLFRQIYAGETEGRKGVYSVKRDFDNGNLKFSNGEEFDNVIKICDPTSKYLMNQLFNVEVLKIDTVNPLDEALLSSRACFNDGQFNNLEKYLKLIVRFATPDPQETFRLYQDAVDLVKQGELIESIFKKPEFILDIYPLTHVKFWNVLYNQCYGFTREIANDAIATLLAYIPRYSLIYGLEHKEESAFRRSSIFCLIYLLDRVGWGRTSRNRLNDSAKDVVEIAQRIFGEGEFDSNTAFVRLLASKERGVLGWNDLMLFRLHCSPNMQQQTWNIHKALILYDDENAHTEGLLSTLAKNAMRTISQRVFQHFRETYIDKSVNFFTEVDDTPDEIFFGDLKNWFNKPDIKPNDLDDRLLATRSAVKSFVFYQLASRESSNGTDVGCGLYDASGNLDEQSISQQMNKYIFEVCFNPSISENNIYHFADYCLRNLSSNYFMTSGKGYSATEISLAQGLDSEYLKRYWINNQNLIKEQNLLNKERRVVTLNYVATYSEHLPSVFEVLDNMVKPSVHSECDPNNIPQPT